VEHAAVGRGMGEALESITATDSPVFAEAREKMAEALDELLTAGTAAGTLRRDVDGRVLLRALGGICGMRSAGWRDDAVTITTILYDGLRHGTGESPVAVRTSRP
jgi:hypothetical protein